MSRVCAIYIYIIQCKLCKRSHLHHFVHGLRLERQRLERQFGLRGVVLEWSRSYLSRQKKSTSWLALTPTRRASWFLLQRGLWSLWKRCEDCLYRMSRCCWTSRWPLAVFKHAVVCPLLKTSGLDAGDTRNYRPVSNLSFLSKLLERVAQRRLQAFSDSHDLMPTTRSVYRIAHSIETAVTAIYSDLLMAAANRQISALCVLDLTAAFDTVDHEPLILRLGRQFGLYGVVLEWSRSHLNGRTVQVVYDGQTLRVICVVCSVPQGSVLGPRLFVLYTAELADKVDEHGVKLHAFADEWRHTIVCTLSSRRCTVCNDCHDTTATVHHGHRSMDGGEPT